FVAHGGGPALRGAHLEVSLAGTHVLSVPDLVPQTVEALGKIAVPVPDVGRAGMRRIELVLKDANGSVLASNYLEIAVHPREPRSVDIGALWSPDDRLRKRLRALGYCLAEVPEAAKLWVTTRLDPEVAAHVRQGGRLLMFPAGEFDLNPLFPHWQRVKVRRRAGTVWSGDWASSFGWLHRPCAFSRIPGGPLLDETSDRVLPRYVISGCNLLDFQARVHAGLVVGWIHKPAACIVERGYGKGRFVVSTFRLFRDPPGADPTATVLLDSLLALAMAEGSAAARDHGAVINEMVDRSRSSTPPHSP
ncbi:MAG: glycoside hydrolase family 2, partial [Alphaproteobacteria bacterium]|nr:glycoside hydrolase family 2 [Alphaproteobacteria bacterium]